MNNYNTYERDVEKMLSPALVTQIGSSLGGTLSATQALLNGAVQDPELRHELLGGIDNELRYLWFLFENGILLHTMHSKKMKLNYRKINLSEWLTTLLISWQKTAPEKRLQWNLHFAENLPYIYADPERLAQGLGNLLYASILCAPPASTIRVEVQPEGAGVKIRVCDAGPKINPLIILGDIPTTNHQNFENHPRLQKGLGLGIVLAHRIVLAHEGEMVLDESENFNNCISIRLPV